MVLPLIHRKPGELEDMNNANQGKGEGPAPEKFMQELPVGRTPQWSRGKSEEEEVAEIKRDKLTAIPLAHLPALLEGRR